MEPFSFLDFEIEFSFHRYRWRKHIRGRVSRLECYTYLFLSQTSWVKIMDWVFEKWELWKDNEERFFNILSSYLYWSEVEIIFAIQKLDSWNCYMFTNIIFS